MLPPFLWTDICPKGISGIRVKRLCRNRRSLNLRQQTERRPFFGTSRRMGVDRYFIQKRKCPRKKNKTNESRRMERRKSKLHRIGLHQKRDKRRKMRYLRFKRYIFHHSGGKCQIELCPIHTLRQVQNFRRNIGLCRSNAA